MAELRVVDPDGDLIIIHRARRESFAPWGHAEGLSDIEDGEADTKTIETPSDPHDDDVSPSPAPELRFKVSSKHLTLASHRFKKMLAGDYQEANLTSPDGCRQVILDTFDSDALEILLNVIHGRNNSVPRSLSLEMVAKVSEWVDDLDCYEQVEIFGDMWIRQLENSLPKEYGRDLVLWIFISFVFRQPSLFKSATRTAILHNTDSLQTIGLPLRPIIAERIDQQRLEILGRLTTHIYEVFDSLFARCSFECDSILLGALLKQIRPLGLWPRPSEPYANFSFAEIARAVRSFQSPNSDGDLHPEAAGEYPWDSQSFSKMKKKKKMWESTWIDAEPVVHDCSLRDLLEPSIDHLGRSVSGLNLEDIPSSGLYSGHREGLEHQEA